MSGVIAGLAPALAANEVLGMVVRFGFLIAIIVAGEGRRRWPFA